MPRKFQEKTYPVSHTNESERSHRNFSKFREIGANRSHSTQKPTLDTGLSQFEKKTHKAIVIRNKVGTN